MNTLINHKTIQQNPSRTLHISLWIIQGLLASMYLMAGSTKLLQPISDLSQTLPWVTTMSEGMVRFIGLSELFGGIGIILPSLLRIKPTLSILAALGLAFIQLFAGGFHLYRGEISMIGMNTLLMLLAVFVAWGRFRKVPILSKS